MKSPITIDHLRRFARAYEKARRREQSAVRELPALRDQHGARQHHGGPGTAGVGHPHFDEEHVHVRHHNRGPR
jgi:hypothetical protein